MENKSYYSSDGIYHLQNGDQKKNRIRGRGREILIASMAMILPMILFSGLLLGLIFHLRVVHNGFVSSNLAFKDGHDDPDAIYVRISSTTLITIASWSSTLAPLLVGFAITLTSYPVSRGLLRAGGTEGTQRLPTPHQLTLILQMITNGSPVSLWHWIKYTVGWRGRREKQGSPIKTIATILTLGIVLSTLVLITDTWLHFTTKTVNFVQTSANSEQPNHSFRLVDRCTDVNITYFGGCSLDQAAAGAFLINGSTSLAVLSNVSQTTAVITHENHGRQFAYLGVAPQLQLADIDFTAKSWALETECKPVTSKCIDDQRIYGAATPYKCPFDFEGLLMTPNANVMTTAYFTNSTASDNSTHSVSLENPYYFASITKVNRNIGVSKALGSDPEISIAVHGGVLSVLFCNTTVYDLEYSLVNGSVTRFLTTPSNSSMANLFQGGQQYTKVGDPTLIQAASIAALGDTAQNLADSFALSYSQTALAVSAGIFVPEEVIESQHRQNILVAKVPKAPLMSLIAANLLLVVLGIVLTVIAFISLQGETGEIQARLSIAALVAAHFEGDRSKKPVEHVDDIFEERDGLPGPRIGFAKTEEDAWTFTSWRP